MPRSLSRAFAPALLALSLALAPAARAAVTLTVTNANDSGPGSLRAALATALADQAGDTVTFDPTVFRRAAPQTITLTSGEMVIGKYLTIQGPGADALTVSGGHASRVFDIEGQGQQIGVSLSGLTIADGNSGSDSGGGIESDGAELTLTDCVLRGNASGGNGGGLYCEDSDDLFLTDCIIEGNSGGGVATHGADAAFTGCTFRDNAGGGLQVFNYDVTITDCTFDGNDGGGVGLYQSMTRILGSTFSGNRAASGDGGGVSSLNGNLTLSGCTVVGNTASGSGGGVFSGGGTTTVTSSLIATNTASGGGPDVSGAFTSGDSNLIGDPGAAADGFTGPHDLFGMDPKLDPRGLRDNGGPTETVAVLTGSPAIGGDHHQSPPGTIGAYQYYLTHLLWDNPDGRMAFWNVDPQGTLQGLRIYGPYTDGGGGLWHATALATGPDGISHILWNSPNGQAALWDVTDDGSATVLAGFGPYTDGAASNLWRASSLSVGPDGGMHLLWTNPDGKAAFWNVTPGGSPSVLAGYGPFFDGSSPWDAAGVSTGPDNVSHLLWHNADGTAAFWNVSDTDGTASVKGSYGPFTDGAAANLWGAVGISTGPDNVSHLLWDNVDGKAAFWNVSDADGTATALAVYGPFFDGSSPWSATGLATGPDGVSRLLWNNPDGKAALWTLGASGGIGSVSGYGPYTDGPANSLWGAVGVSAGP